MIRPATTSDLPALLDIWNPVIRESAITFTTAEKTLGDLENLLAERAASGHGLLVALSQGRVAGFATYGPFRSGPGYAHTVEHTILMAPTAQGRGLGRQLLTALEGHARAGGAHCMIAGISGENPRARDFHATQGFALVAVLPQVGWKFGRWMDLVLMQKFLT